MIARVGSPKTRFESADSKAKWIGLVPSGSPIDLNLPYGAKLRTTGIELPKNLGLDQWKEIGTKLAAIDRGMQWAIGEWWRFGYHKYGDRKVFAEAKALPYEFESLMNIGTVEPAPQI